MGAILRSGFLIGIIVLSLNGSMAQEDSVSADTTIVLPSILDVTPQMMYTHQSVPKQDFKAKALFCRIEAGLKKKTGIDWNIGMDVR